MEVMVASRIGGFTNWPNVCQLLQHGFATVSTDTGHRSGHDGGSWALNSSEAAINCRWRSPPTLFANTTIAQSPTPTTPLALLEVVRVSRKSRSSRMTLMVPWLVPPAWWMNHLSPCNTWLSNHDLLANASHHVTLIQIAALAKEAMAQCDPEDGITNNIILNPKACKFNIDALSCSVSGSNVSVFFKRRSAKARKIGGQGLVLQ
ncbi:uncharacterized protein ATNIH1004_001899 [Aspergillus tanneri]|nr:uncharacterized protein ATNIH1004_001899 [Aspergillus tanneri]KAA8641434.1 hypothetical protein ATNIH1004_001899 [Aspergillus tanneri]